MPATRKCRDVAFGKFHVRVVPVLRDNFSYILQCHGTKRLALVDVSTDYEPVVRECRALLGGAAPTAALVDVFSTHKHHDHTGGNVALAQSMPGLRVVGGAHEPVPAKTESVGDGQRAAFGDLVVSVMHTPCHTAGHVLLHFHHRDEPDAGAIFTGDTVFVGGLGAFFEGTAAQMIAAMRRVAALPPATALFPGHEYTCNFMKFAQQIEPDNAFVAAYAAQAAQLQSEGVPTVPSTVGDELQMNPFMRAATGVAALMGRLPAAARVSDVAAMEYLYNACP